MEDILKYIKDKYKPMAIILYGSYADSTNTIHSDFDALVITSKDERIHDTSYLGDVELDVFVYPISYFEGEYDLDEFITIYDGKIIMDTNSFGYDLKEKVKDYLLHLPKKTEEEIRNDISWCLKMEKRAERSDAEGLFRMHWVLTESLEIYAEVLHKSYFGPKKTLLWMKEEKPDDYQAYLKALKDFSLESLDAWISIIQKSYVPEDKQ